jgi:NhaA family Na+:H+ antiporter
VGLGVLPSGVGVRHVWGLAVVGGIGFTVSLFVADLAYGDPGVTEQAKVGIFAGSLVSAVLGSAILRFGRIARSDSPPARDHREPAATSGDDSDGRA